MVFQLDAQIIALTMVNASGENVFVIPLSLVKIVQQPVSVLKTAMEEVCVLMELAFALLLTMAPLVKHGLVVLMIATRMVFVKMESACAKLGSPAIYANIISRAQITVVNLGSV